ncbi:MAG TPA: hypothetical protein VGE45_08300 [Chloroflexia bacterium]|jgi:hypothetical protein
MFTNWPGAQHTGSIHEKEKRTTVNDMQTNHDLPDSVDFLVVLSYVTAALYLVLIVMLFLTSVGDFDSGGSPTWNWPLIPARRRDIGTIYGLLALSMAFSFLIGAALARMQRWVRVVGSVGYILLAIWQLITIFNTTYYSNSLLVGPVFSIIFVGLLNSPAVKQALQSVLDTRPKRA